VDAGHDHEIEAPMRFGRRPKLRLTMLIRLAVLVLIVVVILKLLKVI
jgi:hypothetical protein